MARLSHRDMTAFETLYERYGTLVYSVALRVTAEPEVAEDVAQETFLRLWRSPERYDPDRGRFLTWLLSATRNRAVDQVRTQGRRRKRETTTDAPHKEPAATEMADPALAAQLSDVRHTVRTALRDLPPEQRQVIELAYYDGHTQQEIAGLLNQPLGTVKTRIRLGMRKLRAALASELKEL
jgi:RNA polymerase sigma-70 factor (ECF subfamily)